MLLLESYYLLDAMNQVWNYVFLLINLLIFFVGQLGIGNNESTNKPKVIHVKEGATPLFIGVCDKNILIL